MNTNVIPMFAFNDQQLRGIKIDGEPWFIAADACRILGFQFGNGKGSTARYLATLDTDERQTVSRRSRSIFSPLFEGGKAQSMILISRPGLLKLIQRSSKPEAKAFDRYVRHEVLPQIMDSGVAPRTSWG